ncbi:MAG: metallophosphoesterase [Acidimicrobiia bacterium]
MTITEVAGLHLPSTGLAVPWSGLDRLPRRPDEFSFVLLSDRTGLARPGVYERAVDITNLLRPDFALQVGDMIEGYTSDPLELERQWAEFDAIADGFEVPFFRTPGNHDVSNDLMRAEWRRRHGLLYYHYRYRDVLFVVLDTQDPPQRLEDFSADGLVADEFEKRIERMRELQRSDPAKLAAMVEGMMDWSGTMPANISDQQVAWAEEVIAANAGVRWTVLSMHIPAWQGAGHPGLDRIRRVLGDRPYTMFAGHTHNYRRTVIDGRDHIRLGATGGLWCHDGDDGNFDHVTLVTVSDSDLKIANVVLEGVIGKDGGAFRPTPWSTPLRREPAGRERLHARGIDDPQRGPTP